MQLIGIGRRTLLPRCLMAGLLAVGSRAHPARAEVAPMMRYPNASANSVAFVAHGDLWTAPLGGGVATRLVHGPDTVLYPRFSPDGRWIAFTARSNGASDVFLIPAAGGAARRAAGDGGGAGRRGGV